MSSKGTYYQFITNFNGDYIRGYMVSVDASDRFFNIIEPTFSNPVLSNKIKPVNKMICLSKDAVVCYYEIEEN